MTNLEYIELLDEETLSELFYKVYYSGYVAGLKNAKDDDFIWTPTWLEKRYNNFKFWEEDLIEQ